MLLKFLQKNPLPRPDARKNYQMTSSSRELKNEHTAQRGDAEQNASCSVARYRVLGNFRTLTTFGLQPSITNSLYLGHLR